MNSSEVETSQAGRVWWEHDAHPIFDVDCFKEISKIDKFVQHIIKTDYAYSTSGF